MNKTSSQIKEEIYKLQCELTALEGNFNEIPEKIIINLLELYNECFRDQYDKDYEVEITLPLIFRLTGLIVDKNTSEEDTYFDSIKLGVKVSNNSREIRVGTTQEEYIDEELGYINIDNGEIDICSHLEGYIYDQPIIKTVIEQYCKKMAKFNLILKQTAETYNLDKQTLFDHIIKKANNN